MLKHLLCPLFAIVTVILIAVFPWRLKFVEIPIRDSLEYISGKPVIISKVIYHPFAQFTIEGLNIDGSMTAERTTVYVNLLNLIKYRDITKSIRKIIIYKPDIDLGQLSKYNLPTYDAKGLKHTTDNKPNELILIWNDGKLSFNGYTVTAFSGRAKLGSIDNAEMKGECLGGKIICNSNYKKIGDSNILNTAVSYMAPNSDIIINLCGKINKNNNIEVYCDIPKIRISSYSLENSSAVFKYNRENMSGTLYTRAGKAGLSGRDFNVFSSSGDFDFSKISGIKSGRLGIIAYKDIGGFNGNIKLNNFHTGEINIKSAFLNVKNNLSGEWDLRGNVDPNKYTIEGAIKNNKYLKLDINLREDGVCSVEGKLHPLHLNISGNRLNIKNIPFFSHNYPGIKGLISIKGVMRNNEQKYIFKIIDIKYADMSKDTVDANFLCKNDKWFVTAKSEKHGWLLKSKYLKVGNWDAKIRFAQSRLEDIIKWGIPNHTVKGILNGDIYYSSKSAGNAKIGVKDLVCDNNYVGDVKGNIIGNNKLVKVESVTLSRKSGKISLWGQIGLFQESDQTKLNINFHQIDINGVNVDGRLLLVGKYHNSEETLVSGFVKSGKFRIGKWFTKDLSASIKLTKSELNINSLDWYPLLKGRLTYSMSGGKISGDINLEKIPIENIEPTLQGTLRGAIKIRGTLKTPDMELIYSSPQTTYHGVSFSQKGILSYAHNILRVKTLNITSENTSIDISGAILPKYELKVNVKDLQGKTIGLMAGIKDKIDGLYSGYFKLSGNIQKPEIKVTVTGRNVSYNDFKLDEFKAEGALNNSIITVHSLLAKYMDSELKVQKNAIFDLAKLKFNVKTECRNIHAGPFDIFGVIGVYGNLTKTSGVKYNCSAEITTGNMWINQFNLNSFKTGLTLKNGDVYFMPKKSADLKISGMVGLNTLPQIKFNGFKVRYKETSELGLEGVIGINKWDFTASGKNMDVSAVGELAGLTFPCNGKLDFGISGKGSLDNPQFESDIILNKGKISEIPYDDIRIQLSAKQDVITIIKSRLESKDQFSILLSGYCPFYLTTASKQRIKRNPINLSITAEKGSLAILKILSNDIQEANGSFRAKARISGTVQKPIVNGFFKSNSGQIISDRYFKKLTNLNVDLLWRNNLLSVKDLSGKIGDGATRIQGKLYFDGLKPSKYDFTWVSLGDRGIHITVPELPIPSPLFKSEKWQFLSNLSQGDPRFMLHFTGPVESPLLSGWVELDNTHFSFPSLAKGGGNETILDELWPKLNWDLEFRATKNTWYDNELVSANITGALKLTGRGLMPTPNGHIEVISGNIVYFGTEFKIKEGSLDITKDGVIIEGQAETEIYGNPSNQNDTDTIQLFIDKSDLFKMKPRFVSINDPSLTPEQAMAKATGIDPHSTSTSDMAFMMRKSVIRFIDSTLTTPLAKNLLNRSGIVDTFKVQYNPQDAVIPADPANPTIPELLAGTKYSLEKFITTKMMVGYSMTFNELQNKLSLRHGLDLSYNIIHNLFIRGSYELSSDNLLHENDRSIMLEHQWRFGPAPKKKKTSIQSKP